MCNMKSITNVKRVCHGAGVQDPFASPWHGGVHVCFLDSRLRLLRGVLLLSRVDP